MDWNSNLRTFLPRPETSFDFLYNYNYDQYPGMEMKHTGMAEKSLGLIPGMDKNNYGSQEKKKRLTTDQLDSLERSFQEEIKLDPDRKMKLSRDLGLQPRQIAVWFQNRRARWKAKQLEMLYDALKQEFDAVSKEKQKLQEEVCTVSKPSSPCNFMHYTLHIQSLISPAFFSKPRGSKYPQLVTLKCREKKQVESTSLAMRNKNKPIGGVNQQQNLNNAEQCNYVFNVVEEYNNPAVSSPFWGVLPSYP
ncbi:hypothetical protein Pint_35827 [Pistacia integerrima]|uniref:Uncharacterized protein n=1 Tax=Pistacia integerrima TaxID=434235 RepID=A0ACC0Y540_9ROSI|nr:hypothetical protein Pint_35827 [Pistacia integerrima]